LREIRPQAVIILTGCSYCLAAAAHWAAFLKAKEKAMKRTNHSALAVRALALTVVGIACVGCCDNEKNQIQSLSQEYNELAQKNKDVNGQLAGIRARESQLMGQMDAKDLQLTALETENKELRAKLSSGPVTPPSGTRETTVYTETVGTDVLFSAGRATLTSGGRTRLGSIAATLKSKYPGLAVRVMGYTDSDPIVKTKKLWKDNLDLSANRAMEVTRYLWGKGIPAKRIETVGMGATHFVASNASKAGKTSNRRVEIIVVRK